MAAATVSWQPPASDGGSAITSYTATGSPVGATCTTAGTSCAVRGLFQWAVVLVHRHSHQRGGEWSGELCVSFRHTIGLRDTIAPIQTASVSLPKKIKFKGSTVLLARAVRTNAGQRVVAKVAVSPRAKKYSVVKVTSTGKVTIKTFGKKKLTVTLTLTAPSNSAYSPYSATKVWTVKK